MGHGTRKLKVGELARRSGLSIRSLRYYDQVGLLKPSGRSEGGHRLYGDADVWLYRIPTDMPYGYREYGARDPEGGLWSFMAPLD